MQHEKSRWVTGSRVVVTSCFTHLTVNNELAVLAQVFGQQRALHVTAERVLRRKWTEVYRHRTTAKELKVNHSLMFGNSSMSQQSYSVQKWFKLAKNNLLPLIFWALV